MHHSTREQTDLSEARKQLELKAVAIQTAAIERLAEEVGLSESWDDDRPSTSTRARPRNPLSTSAYTAWTSIKDNAEGRYWPFYDYEHDILKNLAATRNLASYDSTAIGAAQSLRAYVLGGEWQVIARYHDQDKTKSRDASRIQSVVDRLLDRWEFWDVALPSILDEAREDGERFVTLYPAGMDVLLDFMEPEQCREPANSRELNEWLDEAISTWYFGVHCRKHPFSNRPDWARPLGYHFVDDDAGRSWDYLPSWPQPEIIGDSRCCFHWKRNAPLRAARGVSDFYPILADLERVYKIYRNTGDGAAIQAAIAMVIQRASSSRAATINDVAGNAIDAIQSYRSSTSGGQTTYVRRFDSGSVIETDKDSVYNPGPMGQPSGQNFTEVASALLRSRISIRWNMPEYLISGDASNQNYASALVSESPFVKYCEREQTQVRGMIQAVLWRAFRMLHVAGKLSQYGEWKAFEEAVDLDVISGDVATRDALEQTQRFQILHQSGVVSGKVWAQKEGLPEEDVRDVQPQQPPQPQGAMPGDASPPTAPVRSQESFAAEYRRMWLGYP